MNNDVITEELVEAIKKELLAGKSTNVIAAEFQRPRWLVARIKDSLPQQVTEKVGVKAAPEAIVHRIKELLVQGRGEREIIAEMPDVTPQQVRNIKKSMGDLVPSAHKPRFAAIDVCVRCGLRGAILDLVNGICVECGAKAYIRNQGASCYK